MNGVTGALKNVPIHHILIHRSEHSGGVVLKGMQHTDIMHKNSTKDSVLIAAEACGTTGTMVLAFRGGGRSDAS